MFTTGKRKRSLQRQLAYAAIPTILAFFIIEGLFRLYSVAHNANEVRQEYERLSRDPAFMSKPWFSRQFVAALLAQPPGHYSPRGTHLVLPNDTEDGFYSIREGTRATVGFDRRGPVQGRRSRKLAAVGGSTTYCMEVPDQFT
jgi:hypothetical protein